MSHHTNEQADARCHDAGRPAEAAYRPDAETVAAHNDAFRRQACRGIPAIAPDGRALRGRVVSTAGVAACGEVFPLQCLLAVAAHDTFEPENDYHGYHDFGEVRVGGVRVWFKVDIYADERMAWGSERPDDPALTFRVLTIMLPSEY